MIIYINNWIYFKKHSQHICLYFNNIKALAFSLPPLRFCNLRGEVFPLPPVAKVALEVMAPEEAGGEHV